MRRNPTKFPERGKRSPRRALSIPELDEARLDAESHFAPYVHESPAFAATRIGRPSTYDQLYCQTVMDQAALGHTLGATAALIGAARSTVLDWACVHLEFADAIERSKQIRQRFYEGHLIDMVRRGGDSTRFSAVKLGLINVGADDWKEKLPADVNVEFSLAALVGESLRLAEPRTIDGTPSTETTREPVDPIDLHPLRSKSRQDL